MVKKILFVCRHNVFRSRAAEEFFKKYNKNKKLKAESAGLFKWKKENLKNDVGYKEEVKAAKKFGINLRCKSRCITHDLFKKTNLIIIVANDIDKSIFMREPHFKGKTIVWKVRDIMPGTKDKYSVAFHSIKEIEEKVKGFVRGRR